jgi:hypothetical protein
MIVMPDEIKQIRVCSRITLDAVTSYPAEWYPVFRTPRLLGEYLRQELKVNPRLQFQLINGPEPGHENGYDSDGKLLYVQFQLTLTEEREIRAGLEGN